MQHTELGSEEPTFTVVINNYNYCEYLARAVENIARQSHRNFELLIVDDGSSDGSINYILSLSVPYRLIQANRSGQAVAYLYAVADADVPYICFSDADDGASPDLFEVAISCMHERPAKLRFQLTPIDADGNLIAPAFHVALGGDVTNAQ